MVSQQDVTGTTIFVSEEKLSEIIHALSPDQRRYSKLLALATREPTEIWQAWESDPTQEGNWLQLRTYLLFFEVTETETVSPYGLAVVRFSFNKRWELHDMNVQVGEKTLLVESMNQTIRKSELVYLKT
jgi:phage-Barnase-EndoU-ColicinE5/D-RelE like nuclease2